jgi:hypothetical protein
MALSKSNYCPQQPYWISDPSKEIFLQTLCSFGPVFSENMMLYADGEDAVSC